MMSKSSVGVVSLVLILMAASSLVSMFSVMRIDSIVHGDLYRFGLEFSYQWALPYWTMTTIVFAVGWFNIILAFAFQFYVLLFNREESKLQETPAHLESTQAVEVVEIAQEPKEQPLEEVKAPFDESQEFLPAQTEQSEQPVENVEATPEEVPQTQTESSAEATDGAAEKYPEEAQPSETEPEKQMDEQKPQESQPTEQQPTTESQEPPQQSNDAPEQQTNAEKPEETQTVVETPVAADEQQQQPTQTATPEDSNPPAQQIEPSQS